MDNNKFGKKDYFLIGNLVLALLIWTGDCLYLRYDELWIKSATSALFVVIGIINLYFYLSHRDKPLKFPILMLTGLTFAMLGDIILEIEFIVGAALFAVGHIFYFVSYAMLEKPKWTDFIYGACIFIPAVLLITLAPIFKFGGAMLEILCCVYAAIISCMVGKAASDFVRVRSKLNLVILLGSALFFISDLMLLFNVFSSVPYTGAICLATYYPAEILLGFSIFVYASAKNSESGTAIGGTTVGESDSSGK